jgi:hypothetical protein
LVRLGLLCQLTRGRSIGAGARTLTTRPVRVGNGPASAFTTGTALSVIALPVVASITMRTVTATKCWSVLSLTGLTLTTCAGTGRASTRRILSRSRGARTCAAAHSCERIGPA